MKSPKFAYNYSLILLCIYLFSSCSADSTVGGWQNHSPSEYVFPVINIVKFENDTYKDYVCRSLCDFSYILEDSNYEVFSSRDTITFNIPNEFLNPKIYINEPYIYLDNGYYMVNWKISNHFTVNIGFRGNIEDIGEIPGEHIYQTTYYAKCNMTTTDIKWDELNNKTNNKTTLLNKQNYPIISEYKIISKSDLLKGYLKKNKSLKCPEELMHPGRTLYIPRNEEKINEFDDYYNEVKNYLTDMIKKEKLETITSNVELLQ